jgi:hypothetical protein
MLDGHEILLAQMPGVLQMGDDLRFPDAVEFPARGIHLIGVMLVLFGIHKRVAC